MQVWYNPQMNKVTILRYETVSYPSEPGKTRRLAVVSCPQCGREKMFRTTRIPSEEWVCRKCVTYNNRSEVQCSNCGIYFTRLTSNLNSSKSGHYFCSRFCKEQQQTIGGLLELPHYGSGTGSSTYRKMAFEAYGKKCFECDITESYLLVVHHKDGNRDNNQLGNLEILCHNHHADKHKKLVNGDWVLDTKYLLGD